MSYADSQTVKERSGVSANDLNNVQNSSELDNLISRLNDRAKSLIDEYCQRDFEEYTGETVKVDGNGRSELSLPQYAAGDGLYYPIISISSVSLNGNALDASDYRIKPQPNALSNRNAGVIERKNARWPEGWENIEVTLDWGYQSPPDEIKSVAESLIVDQLLNSVQDSKSSGADSVSMDGYSVSFSQRMRLDDQHKEQLGRFRRVIV
jgi:hypothetical protein